MSRVVVTLITLVAALFGAVALGPAVAAAAPAALSYIYNERRVGAVVAYNYTDRGPPTACDLATAYNRVDDPSADAQARPHAGNAPGASAYDDLAMLVLAASVAAKAQRPEQSPIQCLGHWHRGPSMWDSKDLSEGGGLCIAIPASFPTRSIGHTSTLSTTT